MRQLSTVYNDTLVAKGLIFILKLSNYYSFTNCNVETESINNSNNWKVMQEEEHKRMGVTEIGLKFNTASETFEIGTDPMTRMFVSKTDTTTSLSNETSRMTFRTAFSNRSTSPRIWKRTIEYTLEPYYYTDFGVHKKSVL